MLSLRETREWDVGVGTTYVTPVASVICWCPHLLILAINIR